MNWLRTLALIAFTSLICHVYGQYEQTPRSFVPDTKQLDFIYHNHEEMTDYLRYSIHGLTAKNKITLTDILIYNFQVNGISIS